MSQRKDEKWLDGELRRAIDGATPEFDAEAWKRKYPAEFQAVLARAAKGSKDQSPNRPRIVRLVLGHPGAGVAVAAAIVITAAVLFVGPGGHQPPERGSEPRATAPSPTKIVSMMSLRMAYRRGGEEGLNQQLDTALNTLGPRPNGVSMRGLFDDLES